MTKVTGEFTDINTNRNLKSTKRVNSAFNPLVGVANGKDSTTFEIPKRKISNRTN